MRILMVHNHYQKYGGEDVVFEQETKLLRTKGETVDTLTFQNHPTTSLKNKLGKISQIFYNKKSAKKLTEKIKAFQPDIIHVHNFFHQASPSIFFIAKKHQIPVVLTLHNYRLLCINGLLLRKEKVCELCLTKKMPWAGIRHKCYGNSLLGSVLVTAMNVWHRYRQTWKNKISTYLVLTPFVKTKLLRSALNLSKEQVVVKPNFVEDVGFAKAENRKEFYLFIGRLSTEKGIEVLLEALEHHSFALHIVGTGDLQEKIETKAQQHRAVEYLGFRAKSEVITQLKQCRALLFPSIWYEGLPMTILEAFSTGTPVIASDIGNINSIIQDKINGLHFKTKDARSLAQTIQNFEKSESLDLYHNARKTFEQKYSPNSSYQAMKEVYTQAQAKMKK